MVRNYGRQPQAPMICSMDTWAICAGCIGGDLTPPTAEPGHNRHGPCSGHTRSWRHLHTRRSVAKQLPGTPGQPGPKECPPAPCGRWQQPGARMLSKSCGCAQRLCTQLWLIQADLCHHPLEPIKPPTKQPTNHPRVIITPAGKPHSNPAGPKLRFPNDGSALTLELFSSTGHNPSHGY